VSLDIPRIKAICFDVDGTLSDTDDLWVESLSRRLHPVRRLFPQQNSKAFARWAIMCAETPGNMLYHFFDRIHLDRELGRLYNYIARHRMSLHSRQFRIIEGIRACLLQLHQHYPMAVVSARDRKTTLSFLSCFDMLHLFPVVATALTCRHTKPFPDPILWAADLMGVRPEDCLMVGDTTVDIRAGRAAGAQTVGVLSGFGREHELRRAGADLILPSAAALGLLLSTLSDKENMISEN
jgi:N-acetyl-D-muramate 6-phosphate phosphatase